MSLIKFAELDLRGAFDFAIMIEEDAQNRYAELARRLGNDPGGAGDVFRKIAKTEAVHRRTLVERRAAIFAADPPRIEISVAAEGVERPAVDDDDLPTTARGALEAAVAAERRAEVFYAEVAPTAKDPAVRAFLEQLMREETEHAAILEQEIARLGPAAPREPRRPAVEPQSRPADGFPDRRTLEDALPRFDAATRVIAASAIAGLGEAQIAAALGVMRSTVSRKLSQFLAVARRQAAVAVAAATLAGCAGALPHSDGMPHGAPALPDAICHAPGAPVVEEVVAPPTPQRAPKAAPRDELATAVHSQVATRMRRHDPEVHGRIAGAILAEAKRAGLDPLLVLALIHVESSFDPFAVSNAGARGLMQLLEPTMRSELERANLPLSDPHDPVANVQAGVRYLRRLIDAFGGNTDVALMAYNAGPNRIRGHLRNGGIPDRFHVYPERINRELNRLRVALGGRLSSSTAVARADVPDRPRG
jgi:rubrerythrin